uniref:Microtubule-associated protein futsch n=1 Tax=Parastrongyloides trichosuri TaxID=131310 RepID=A0A0N4Z873_PARTI
KNEKVVPTQSSVNNENLLKDQQTFVDETVKDKISDQDFQKEASSVDNNLVKDALSSVEPLKSNEIVKLQEVKEKVVEKELDNKDSVILKDVKSDIVSEDLIDEGIKLKKVPRESSQKIEDSKQNIPIDSDMGENEKIKVPECKEEISISKDKCLDLKSINLETLQQQEKNLEEIIQKEPILQDNEEKIILPETKNEKMGEKLKDTEIKKPQELQEKILPKEDEKLVLDK